MRLWPVLGLRLAAHFAFFDSRYDDALGNIRQIDWCADAALEDREVRSGELAHSQPMCFERIGQRPHNRYRCSGASGFWFVDHSIPDGTLDGQSFSGEIPPAHAANFALS